MFTLAQLSDVHLAPLPRPMLHQLASKRALGYINWHRRKGGHRRDILDRLVGDLLERKPDHIAVTGDLVNIALPEEFRAARLWLESLGRADAVTVIPGNHDAYVPFLRDTGFKSWQPYMAANDAGQPYAGDTISIFPFVRLFGEIALIGLSSARPTMPAMASGRLGGEQIQRAGKLLRQLGNEGYFRIVLIHHPPLPGMTAWQRALHDASAFRAILEKHGAELVLHGHNHRAMLTRFESTTGPVAIVGAPSASFASNDPAKSAGYNLFAISKGSDGAWCLSMRSRTFNIEGVPTDRHQQLLPHA